MLGDGRRAALHAADGQQLRWSGNRHRFTMTGQVAVRIGGELRDAALAAEVIGRPVMLDAAGRTCRIHRHPANGIDDSIGHRSIMAYLSYKLLNSLVKLSATMSK